jgi:hypothetical protein
MGLQHQHAEARSVLYRGFMAMHVCVLLVCPSFATLDRFSPEIFICVLDQLEFSGDTKDVAIH